MHWKELTKLKRTIIIAKKRTNLIQKDQRGRGIINKTSQRKGFAPSLRTLGEWSWTWTFPSCIKLKTWSVIGGSLSRTIPVSGSRIPSFLLRLFDAPSSVSDGVDAVDWRRSASGGCDWAGTSGDWCCRLRSSSSIPSPCWRTRTSIQTEERGGHYCAI